jgi:hypothetical protein
MGFTTPCFIRKNTPELRKKLEILGYKLNNGKWMGKCLATFRIKETKEWRYVATPEWDLQNNPDIDISIDCGTNESLFLAIAALRDDIDKNQWFTDGDKWIQCPEIKFSTYWAYNDIEVDANTIHKATVNELIELFSQKIQVPQIEWNINDVINKD